MSYSSYRVLRSYPHDSTAFTQGLVYDRGVLYESTGLLGQSSVRRVQLETGRITQRRQLDSFHFGEGITLWDSVLIQLTWRSGVAIIYHRDSLQPVHRFRYRGEGWGLTNDKHHVIMSDGTAWLTFRNPATFEAVRRLYVTDQGRSINGLNDLQYISDTILANVWPTDLIACICPQSGRVAAWIDLTGLLHHSQTDGPINVLNGIAYDEVDRRLFVTGKLWPNVFEIAIIASDECSWRGSPLSSFASSFSR